MGSIGFPELLVVFLIILLLFGGSRIKDVGRVQMSANTYALRSLLNNKEAAAIAIFQAPGSNALALSDNVRQVMARAEKNFPPGVAYSPDALLL